MAVMAHGQANAEITSGVCPTLSCNHEAPIATYDMRGNGDGKTVGCLTGDHAGRPTDYTPVMCSGATVSLLSGGDVCRTLSARHDSSPCADRRQEVIAIQERACAPDLNCGPGGKGYKEDGTAFTLEARNKVQAIAISDTRGLDKGEHGKGWNDDGSAYTLDTMATQGVAVGNLFGFGGESDASSLSRASDLQPTITNRHGAPGFIAVAFQPRYFTRDNKTGGAESCKDVTAALSAQHAGGDSAPHVATVSQVRRLTPVECERLQGLPDGHTKIPWRGKPAEECPDGPRYKGIGNGQTVPVMLWLATRIKAGLEK